MNSKSGNQIINHFYILYFKYTNDSFVHDGLRVISSGYSAEVQVLCKLKLQPSHQSQKLKSKMLSVLVNMSKPMPTQPYIVSGTWNILILL